MTHHIFDLLRGLLAEYGYWAVATALLLENAGVPVPGETVLLLASFLAYSERTLQFGWIVLIGTLAATIGDNLGYVIGQRGGRRLLDRYRNSLHISDRVLDRGERLFANFGPATILFARFVFGMRVIAGPLAGVLRMPWRKFAVFNLLGAALWVTIISFAGYAFGSHWNLLMHFMERFNFFLAALFVAMGLALWWRVRNASSTPS